MGKDVDVQSYTREDRQRHREKVHQNLDVFERMLHSRGFEFDRQLTGMEIEMNLVASGMQPTMSNAAVLDKIQDGDYQTELGQYNIELNVSPRPMPGEEALHLERDLRASLNRADELARQAGSRMVMIGILPTIMPEHFHTEWMSANVRYAALNEAIFALAENPADPVGALLREGDLLVLAALSAPQFLARGRGIGRVKHPGQGIGTVALDKAAGVVARVEGVQSKRIDRARRPEAQRVHPLAAPADHGRVDGEDHGVGAAGDGRGTGGPVRGLAQQEMGRLASAQRYTERALSIEPASRIALLRLGLEIEGFGPGAVMVRALPALLGAPEPGPLLEDLADSQDQETFDAALDKVTLEDLCRAADQKGHGPADEHEPDVGRARADAGAAGGRRVRRRAGGAASRVARPRGIRHRARRPHGVRSQPPGSCRARGHAGLTAAAHRAHDPARTAGSARRAPSSAWRRRPSSGRSPPPPSRASWPTRPAT